MKILHLFPVEKFTEGFIHLINEDFKVDDHSFWIYGEKFPDGGYDYLKESNVCYYPVIAAKLNRSQTEKKLDDFDMILLHSVVYSIVDYFFDHKKLLKKLFLYFWGGDISLQGTWQERLKKKYVVRKAYAVITIISEDYAIIKKRYKTKSKNVNAVYVNEEELLLIDEYVEKKENNSSNKKSLNIQVGNSATKSNNHLEVLKRLSKYKNSNIKIFAPLSYGDSKYAEEVIHYGRSVYGSKFVPMREFISLKDYYYFLSQMDIAIFNMERQQALSNILALLEFGSKMFIRRGSVLDRYIVKTIGCRVNYIDEIDQMDFKHFSQTKKKEYIDNKAKVKRVYSKEYAVKTWEDVFSLYN